MAPCCNLAWRVLGHTDARISCLQEPGRAERAFARHDVATVLKKFYSIKLDLLAAPPGVEIIDFLEAPSSPLPWITEEELNQYAEKFQKTGFTGPLNYYRMMDMYSFLKICLPGWRFIQLHCSHLNSVVNCRNWRLTAPWSGAKITVPAKFIAGDKDLGAKSFGTEQYIKSGGLKSNVPDLEVAIIDGHHFLQQELADRVNSEIISYLNKFASEA
jgi:pimeloyl-ACP methyl ester carboxylesterase